MASNRSKPIELVVANGTHMSKDEIEKRRNREIKAPYDNIKPPKYLTTAQKREFRKVAETLVDLKIFSNLDVDSLASYFVSRDLWVEYSNVITKELQQELPNYDKIEQLSRLQDKAFKQARAAASDNGLTISSRCKLVVPETKEPPKTNKFSKFG